MNLSQGERTLDPERRPSSAVKQYRENSFFCCVEGCERELAGEANLPLRVVIPPARGPLMQRGFIHSASPSPAPLQHPLLPLDGPSSSTRQQRAHARSPTKAKNPSPQSPLGFTFTPTTTTTLLKAREINSLGQSLTYTSSHSTGISRPFLLLLGSLAGGCERWQLSPPHFPGQAAAQRTSLQMRPSRPMNPTVQNASSAGLLAMACVTSTPHGT